MVWFFCFVFARLFIFGLLIFILFPYSIQYFVEYQKNLTGRQVFERQKQIDKLIEIGGGGTVKETDDEGKKGIANGER